MNRDGPLCTGALEVDTYKSFRVLRCPDGQGHLVALGPYEALRRLPSKTPATMPRERVTISQTLKESVLDALAPILFRPPLK
ncbi:MAG: hypothetical protein PHO14_05105 [Kiritimatiellae bacterium]|nr:hypothetical protein [Kiritimatiellia bacterium]